MHMYNMNYAFQQSLNARSGHALGYRVSKIRRSGTFAPAVCYRHCIDLHKGLVLGCWYAQKVSPVRELSHRYFICSPLTKQWVYLPQNPRLQIPSKAFALFSYEKLESESVMTNYSNSRCLAFKLIIAVGAVDLSKVIYVLQELEENGYSLCFPFPKFSRLPTSFIMNSWIRLY